MIEVNICAVVTILRLSHLFKFYNVGWSFVFSGSVCPAHRHCAQCCAVHRAEKEGIANILKPLSIVIHIVTSCNLEVLILGEMGFFFNSFNMNLYFLKIDEFSHDFRIFLPVFVFVDVYFFDQEAFDRLQRMRFHLDLSASEDQRGQILRLQNTVRYV